jgi:hypothetical protein
MDMTWDYTDHAFAKQAQADNLWFLERKINYEEDGVRLDRYLVKTHFDRLRIPDDRKAFLALLLWNKPF